jgi:hypothetical protein
MFCNDRNQNYISAVLKVGLLKFAEFEIRRVLRRVLMSKSGLWVTLSILTVFVVIGVKSLYFQESAYSSKHTVAESGGGPKGGPGD